MKWIFAILCCLSFLLVQAQTEAELEQQAKESEGTERIDILRRIALKNIFKDQPKALRLAAEVIAESEKLEYYEGIAGGIYLKGIVNDVSGNSDSAGYYFTKGYELSQQHNLSKMSADGLNNLGMMTWNKGAYDESLKYFYDALRIYDSLGVETGISKAVSNIGLINQELHRYKEALKFNFRSLKIRLQSDNYDHIARSYNNIGICYKSLDQLDSAMFYYKMGLEYCEKADAEDVAANIYDNMGNVCQLKGEFLDAVEFYKKSLELSKSIVPNTLISANSNLSHLYLELKDYAKAIYHGRYADSVARANQMITLSADANRNLADAFLKINQKDSAVKYYDKWMVILDSVYSEHSAKSVTELETKYETEKKEQQIALLTAENELHEIEIQQTRVLIGAVIFAALLVIIMIMINASRQRYKLKAVLAEEREDLQKTRFKSVIDTEEKERKRIARELHDGLGQLLSTARITVSSIDEEEHPKVQNSLKLLDMAVKEVRNISHNMMPNALINVGLKQALEDMLRKVGESGSIVTKFNCSVDLELQESVKISVYRVVQEVVNNALKYAEASEISLIIQEQHQFLIFEIKDNGKGFNVSQIHESKGIGWDNVYSRIGLIGGEVDVHSSVGLGAAVKLIIPSQIPAFSN